MGSALDGHRQHIHDRKCSLALLAREPEAVHISKSGFLWKRAKVKRSWLRRWCVVRKGVFRYCSEPGQASAFQERVLSGRVVAAWNVASSCQRTATVQVYGFVVEDDSSRRKTFFCDSEEERNAWCWYFQNHATKKVPVNDLYTVDWKNMLGSGYFAAVVRAWDRANGSQVALKIMARSVYRDHLALLGREVAVMHAMGSHPHLLPLQQVLYADQRLYLVTEYLDGGELATRCSAVQPFSEFEAARITRQLLLALSHLHALRICHTDIKPENILFTSRATDAPIKLIDYSLAVFFRQPSEPCGTPEFMAPELIANPDEVAKTGWAGEVDMWAVGVLLYWMLSGHTPFEAPTISQIFVNIELGRWSFSGECWTGVSEAAKGLVRSLLRRNPHHRPSAKNLLRHPWITQRLGHHRQPSLNLHARGVHTLKEVDGEGIVNIAHYAHPNPRGEGQRRSEDLCLPQPFLNNEVKEQLVSHAIEPRGEEATVQDATRSDGQLRGPEAACSLEIPEPGSPAWSTCAESPITPRRKWEYETSDDLESGPTQSQPLGIEDSARCLDSHRSSKCGNGRPQWAAGSPSKACDDDSEAPVPSSQRHQIIDFSDLHKVRGITDLRRAIIAAERNNSLPSLVDEARRNLSSASVQRHGSGKSSLASAASFITKLSVGAGRNP